MGAAHVIVEADGGSRGNPGIAGFGAVLRDAETGVVIAEAFEPIGHATNNVAEYRGLIAGLELYNVHTPEALLEVRMDSKLVIEQMSGRWKIKHPDMRPLAATAQRLAPFGTVWTWIPREQNKDADRLANVAMDSVSGVGPTDAPQLADVGTASPVLGWSDDVGAETRVVLLRHGVTRLTGERRFSGAGGDDPGLTDEGHDQARRAAEALGKGPSIDVLISSPLTRTRETAAEVAAVIGLEVGVDERFREAAFGAWDGLTLAEVEARWPDQLKRWLTAPDARPPRGESTVEVQRRVEAGLRDVLATYPGKTVVVVSHVTPIKLAVRYCMGMPLDVVHKLLLAPASLTTLSFYESGASAVRSFSVTP